MIASYIAVQEGCERTGSGEFSVAEFLGRGRMGRASLLGSVLKFGSRPPSWHSNLFP